MPDAARELRIHPYQSPTDAVGNLSRRKLSSCFSRTISADFVSKLGVVLEEADESLFWIDLLVDAGVTSTDNVRALRTEANELVAIFVTSLRAAKHSTKSEI